MTDLLEQPNALFDEDGQTLPASEIEQLKKTLVARIQEKEQDESRANSHHDKLGKFAAKSGTPAHVDLSSPDGKKLLTVTKKWQGASGQVEKIQTDFMHRAGGKGTGSKQRDEHMRVLKDGIKNSPVNDKTQYRGVKMPKGSDIEGLKGTSFVIPPSSFSSDEKIARGFVDRKQAASTTVVYRSNPGQMKGLHIEKWGDPAYEYEKETVSAGQFKVTDVTKLPGNKGYVIDITHTAMFDWED